MSDPVGPNPGAALDVAVRSGIYETALATGALPTVAELERRLDRSRDEIRASLERLAEAKAIVLQRESRELLMASPFSAVPTPFAVHAAGRLSYGNCIWDALGIPAMLGADARIASSCGCCGEAMELRVAAGSLEPAEGAIHFAVPARRWWLDIVYN